MSPVLTIFRKELRSYLMTPYGWVILAFIVALQSVSLSGTLKAFQLAPQRKAFCSSSCIPPCSGSTSCSSSR